MIFRFLLLSFLAWIVWRWAAGLFRSQPSDTPISPGPRWRQPGPDASASTASSAAIQDLVQCPKCETWKSSADRTRCGRADCPY